MAFCNSNFASFHTRNIPLNKTQELGTMNVNPAPSAALPYNQNITNGINLVASPAITVGHREKVKEISLSLQNAERPMDSLIMIDALQHLAIDYHFKDEIEEALSSQYQSIVANGGVIRSDLYNVSLCFRLLRQEGYPVSADVFNLFTDNDGKFKVSLTKDVRGMMSLYEASQFGTEGEDILEEANAFTSTQLRSSITTHVDHQEHHHHLSKMVMDTIEFPFHKSLPRFMTKRYIKNFGSNYGANKNGVLLQELAKEDFNIAQSFYKRELAQISKWWRDLGLSRELKFARDQPLKWYMWSVATLPDPKLSKQRMELTKPISLIYLMDDIFDVYGTLDELILFTDAINKWDLKAMEELPYHMKLFYKAIYEVTNDISSKVLREHGWDPSDSLRKAWTSLCNAFLVEAKWFASGHVPEAEEYLKNGIISSGVHVVFVHIFFLLGQGINNETIQLLDKIPNQVSIVASILRLWDDLGSAKDENQEGYDGSYIECYMKDNKSSTFEGARQHVLGMISTAWKRLNEELLLTSNPFPRSFTKASVNFARTVSLMYSYDDNQRLPTLEKHVKSMLY